MAARKKFGTFAGVFTPSIMTILGVILYLRLPVIVGEAGLWKTLGIIVVAHLISFTTGLSVASVATDRKVEAGGTYYMLSRSLGLPIGGTLGIALFVGLSFGVSLYVIGFTESFLSYWGFAMTRESIRVTGGIALAALTVVALASTSLVLRLQYVIMAAMALSLLSIVLGRHDLAPGTSVPVPGGSSFITLFAIFFPAVTGFETGVAMSGDLRDPKRSIPRGTLWAIGVGFAVYVSLAFFFAYTVDAAELAGNPRVLLEISAFAPLVALGIWGATLSSALGGILGAPRILQAASQDGVTPSLFAKGAGPESEPRRALVLTFAIALVGVLIGELDVIARIVSMFFIAAYGFLNLSFAIESWGSPDFRPTFRVPKVVGVIGVLACLVVMIQLDLIAMIISAFVLGGLYLLLVRRQLRLESGDAWEGFWSATARVALHRLQRAVGHRRNWRPNVLLFDGWPARIPYLAEFGAHLIDRGGVLSRFDVVERGRSVGAADPGGLTDPGAGARTGAARAGLADVDAGIRTAAASGGLAGGADPAAPSGRGIFARLLECEDVPSEIERIARYHGFAGLEPNTVLLGWPPTADRAQDFVALLRSLIALDRNVLLLADAEGQGFGARRRIDVWWRGFGGNAGLALALVRFLSASAAWRQTSIRFLLLAEDDAALLGAVQRALGLHLEEQRVQAEIRILENPAGHAFPEVLARESGDADLVILGLPELGGRDPEAYVRETNALLEPLGTVLLVRASSFFGPSADGMASSSIAAPAVPSPAPSIPAPVPAPSLPAFEPPSLPELAIELEPLDEEFQSAGATFVETYLRDAYAAQRELLESLAALSERVLQDVERRAGPDRSEVLRAARELRVEFFAQTERVLAGYREQGIRRQADLIAAGGAWLSSGLVSRAGACSDEVIIEPDPAVFRPVAGDGWLRLYKLRKRLAATLAMRPIRHTVPLRSQVRRGVESRLPAVLEDTLESLAGAGARAVMDAERLIARARTGLERLESACLDASSPSDLSALLVGERSAVAGFGADTIAAQGSAFDRARADLLRGLRAVSQAIAIEAERIHRPPTRRDERRWEREAAAGAERIAALPESWAANQARLVSGVEVGVLISGVQARVRAIARREAAGVREFVESVVIERLRSLRDVLAAFLDAIDGDPRVEFSGEFERWPAFRAADVVDRLMARFRAVVESLPDQVELLAAASAARIEAGELTAAETVTVALRSLVDYRLDTELTGPLHSILGELAAAAESAAVVAEEAIGRTSFLVPGADAVEDPGTGGAAVEGAGDGFRDVVRGGIDRLEQAIEDLQRLAEELESKLDARTGTVFDGLGPHGIARAAERLPHYIRSRRGREALSRFRRLGRRTRSWAKEQVVRLLYRRSEAVILARSLEERARGATAEEVRALVASVSPRPDVLDALPYHYRHLFLGKPVFSRDFWVGREAEQRKAAAAIAAHRRGVRGGILVIGERGSGKTTLVQILLRRHLAGAPVYTVRPPAGGSVDVDAFEARLRAAVTGAAGGLSGAAIRPGPAAAGAAGSDPLAAVPTGSVVVLDDVDLWWERSDSGLAVIDHITGLMDRHEGRCLFILAADVRAYRFVSRVREIEERFLSVIECGPFSARQIEEVVLFRHGLTGLTFEVDGRPDTQLSELARAKLFGRLFDHSQGNIGAALNAWVAHIAAVDGDRLRIVEPTTPRLRALDALRPLQLLLLVGFVLHRAVTFERLSRITGLEDEVLRRELGTLRRFGLVVEDAHDVWTLDPFLHPHLARRFLEEGLVA